MRNTGPISVRKLHPLFGAETASKFDALRDDILRWEAEDEAVDQVGGG